MQSVWGVYVPVGAEEFPGPQALRQRLQRCSCGEMSFLPLPCGRCGGRNQEPAFQFALRRAWTQRVRRWALAALYCLVAGYVGYRLWPPLALVVVGVTLAALAFDLLQRTGEGDICFWLFHQSGRSGQSMADIPSIEAITDAYDTDVRRLELMLESDSSPASAERVFYLAQSLTEVYHNRRISALLARCLTVLPLSEGICVDLDQICAWLEPEDLSVEGLRKLGECARLTCLPPGEQTARFVARACALLVRNYAAEDARRTMGYTLKDIPQLASEGTLSLETVLNKRQRVWLSELWSAASGGVTPRQTQPVPPLQEDNVYITAYPHLAEYWLWCVWNSMDLAVFQDLDQTLSSPLGKVLGREWGGVANGA